MARYLEDDDYRADAAYDVRTGVSRTPVVELQMNVLDYKKRYSRC
jgi:hypothetical protein